MAVSAFLEGDNPTPVGGGSQAEIDKLLNRKPSIWSRTKSWFRLRFIIKVIVVLVILGLLIWGVIALVKNWDTVKSKFPSWPSAAMTAFEKNEVKTEEWYQKLRKNATEGEEVELTYIIEDIDQSRNSLSKMYVYVMTDNDSSWGTKDRKLFLPNILEVAEGGKVGMTKVSKRRAIRLQRSLVDLNTNSTSRIEYYAPSDTGVSYEVESNGRKKVEFRPGDTSEDMGPGVWMKNRKLSVPGLAIYGDPTKNHLYTLKYDMARKVNGKQSGTEWTLGPAAVSIAVSPYSPEEIATMPDLMKVLLNGK
jgi:hypothetical protein